MSGDPILCLFYQMIRAKYSHKNIVVDILSSAYQENCGLYLCVKRDKKMVYRLTKLMEYIFEICYLFGDIILSDDQQACACLLYPEKKKITSKAIWLTIKLVFQSTGLRKLILVCRGELTRRKIRPQKYYLYGWVMGVKPLQQGRGIGGAFLEEIINYSFANKRPFYFETIIPGIVDWYQKLGFELYHHEKMACEVFFLRKELPNNGS